MAGRLNRPLPPEPHSGRPPLPVPRHTNDSHVNTPRSRPPMPAPTETYEEVPPLQRPAAQRPPPTPPPGSDEEYVEPEPHGNKNMAAQQRQFQQRQPAKLPDQDEEYESPQSGPTETYEEVPSLLPQPAPQRPVPQRPAPQRQPPPPPGSDEEYEEPAEVQQEHKRTSDGSQRPPLPPPLQQQPDYLAPVSPGQFSPGPTEEYSVVPDGMDRNRNVPTPPPLEIPDDFYQVVPDTKPEDTTTSSLQKELLGKKLKTVSPNLPPIPTEQKTINGIKIMEGLDSDTIQNAKVGLRKVSQEARDVGCKGKSAKRDSSAPDPSNTDVRTKTAMFGQKKTQHTPQPCPQTVCHGDSPSQGSVTSNSSSNASSMVDSKKANATREPPLSRLQETSSVPQVPQTHPALLPRPVPQPRKLRSPGLPQSKGLSSYPWYFDSLIREDAITKLHAMQLEGAFLVRNSTKEPSKPYTLSLLYKNKVWHMHIRIRPDGKFAVGFEKPQEKCFTSVPEMVEYHSQHRIVLVDSDQAGIRLIKHPHK